MKFQLISLLLFTICLLVTSQSDNANPDITAASDGKVPEASNENSQSDTVSKDDKNLDNPGPNENTNLEQVANNEQNAEETQEQDTTNPENAQTDDTQNDEQNIEPTEISPEAEEESEKPDDITQEEIHKQDSFLLQVQLGLLLLTILTGHVLRTRKIVRIHETGLALIYGLIAGGIILVTVGSDLDDKHANLVVEPATCSPGNNITSAERSLLVKIKNNYYAYWTVDKTRPETASILFELQKIAFDPEIFFHLLLPPIIFYAAYSMRKRHFFRNIGTILTFAFIGTLIATFVTAIIVEFFVKIAQTFGSLTTFTFNDCLYFGAIISATDPVTVLAVFKEKLVDVDLDAILFGESILNDAVAIVLAGAIKANSAPNSVLGGASNPQELGEALAANGANGVDDGSSTHAGGIILSFFGVFLGSFFIGSIIATFNALFFKYLPFTTEPIMETSIFVMASWSAFLTAESLGCSGIVAVLFAGILQAQYTYRNLSPLGQTLTKEFFHLLAFVSENFVFCYMGLTITQAAKHAWSFWFILGSFVGIIVGRAANIYPLSWLINYLHERSHRESQVNVPKRIPGEFQHMMMWSGLRGAMAFALAIRDTITSKDQTIFTTTLLICYLTVWILGSGSSTMLDKLGIKVNVDPDADLNRQGGGYQKHNAIFSLWHKLDKKFLRPILTGQLYGENCSPTELSPNAHSSRHQGNLTELRRNSSNFSSCEVEGPGNAGFAEMNNVANNLADRLGKQQNGSQSVEIGFE